MAASSSTRLFAVTMCVFGVCLVILKVIGYDHRSRRHYERILNFDTSKSTTTTTPSPPTVITKTNIINHYITRPSGAAAVCNKSPATRAAFLMFGFLRFWPQSHLNTIQLHTVIHAFGADAYVFVRLKYPDEAHRRAAMVELRRWNESVVDVVASLVNQQEYDDIGRVWGDKNNKCTKGYNKPLTRAQSTTWTEAYHLAKEYESARQWSFDWYILLRPDLVMPVTGMIPHCFWTPTYIYMNADMFAMVPRQYASRFFEFWPTVRNCTAPFDHTFFDTTHEQMISRYLIAKRLPYIQGSVRIAIIRAQELPPSAEYHRGRSFNVTKGDLRPCITCTDNQMYGPHTGLRVEQGLWYTQCEEWVQSRPDVERCRFSRPGFRWNETYVRYMRERVGPWDKGMSSTCNLVAKSVKEKKLSVAAGRILTAGCDPKGPYRTGVS